MDSFLTPEKIVPRPVLKELNQNENMVNIHIFLLNSILFVAAFTIVDILETICNGLIHNKVNEIRLCWNSHYFSTFFKLC